MGQGFILLLGLAVAMVKIVSTAVPEIRTELVAEVVSQVVKQDVNDCHLVLLTTSPHSTTVTTILRLIKSRMVVAGASAEQNRPFRHLWGYSKNCQTLILHIDHNINKTNMALR
ncbi:hypothetical protein Pcinc_002652 [Petrolisthes cinctipes]|uniref:Secreted protein n=1 Tax=Petrolisthes cinctipes TaxID=88211 RepID=A0AAE1L3A6_PETCI|nr:hypothetical protein Pcinc_008870 [Petrolisthes cinctipes]KAK3887097.1 hypothetical protein Pcinc_008784 [Petrolisthes cinctipes]KAK3891919.1 hypothetical protein Pcinc_004225 [Petrolisthes cinctipes]KAK3893587.1 hypothetical protein Pcinc_002652 [Petrolisthes cinctipes]